jgi:hypothetical protein
MSAISIEAFRSEFGASPCYGVWTDSRPAAARSCRQSFEAAFAPGSLHLNVSEPDGWPRSQLGRGGRRTHGGQRERAAARSVPVMRALMNEPMGPLVSSARRPEQMQHGAGEGRTYLEDEHSAPLAQSSLAPLHRRFRREGRGNNTNPVSA